MIFTGLLFATGILCAGYFPSLPPVLGMMGLSAVVLVMHILLRRRTSLFFYLFSVLLGASYGVWFGHTVVANQLPLAYAERELQVTGTVVDLPVEKDGHQLFLMAVKRADLNPSQSLVNFPSKLQLSSYGSLRVKAGEQWQLHVKLKRPRGFVNPGGLDYQTVLLRRGIGATGSVKMSGFNQRLAEAPSFSVDVIRYQLQQWLISASHSPEKGILVALLVGDTSLVDKAHWGEMLKTGTNHLIAISGLHLGFFAIVGYWLGNFFGRFIQLIWRVCPSMIMGNLGALLFTVFYSFIAGFNIPTIRTLIMLAIVQFTLLFRRTFRLRDSLLIALVSVLLYDPLSGYDIGFWLSFSAVSLLLFCFAGRLPVVAAKTYAQRGRMMLAEFTRSQWVMFIGLLIPLALMVHTSSLLAAPANFVAIPVITFFVVPCLILSAVFHFWWSGAEFLFLHAAEWGMSVVHHWLNWLLELHISGANPRVSFNVMALPLAIVGVLFMLLPKGMRQPLLGGICTMVALCCPMPAPPALELLTFDVGQGTSVLIRTAHHQLLYDTGPIYTENFDAGSGIVTPYLQAHAIGYLDKVVVSHHDLDHSGGLKGVLASTAVGELLLGEAEAYEPDNTLPSPGQVQNCHQVDNWSWDGVDFRFITWAINARDKANNHSCVLEVAYGEHRILLTGDIEKPVEKTLAMEGKLKTVDVLLAPHHGSHSSSSQIFVDQLKPTYVIYSAAYHSQHGHPHQDVVERYRAIGALGYNTAFSGALDFRWVKGEFQGVVEARKEFARYWYDPPEVQYE